MAIAAPNTKIPTTMGGVSGTGSSFPGYNRLGARMPGAKQPFLFKQAYPAAVEQQGEDYDKIMGGYDSILSSINSGNPLSPRFTELLNTPATSYSPITPQTYDYKQSPEVMSAMSNMEDLSKTGGYSDNDISALRERGISPIRSIYANAMRDMARRRTISGGYSPNYNASMSKMTRELSDLISSKTNDVNAGIAERVAQNKLGIAPSFMSAASSENARANEYGRGNTDILNRASEVNAQNKTQTDLTNRNAYTQALEGFNSLNSDNISKMLATLGAKSSLYGTTPALVNTFGNQAAQAAQLQEGANTRNRQTGLNLISQSMAKPTQTVAQAPMRFPTTQAPPSTLPPWFNNNRTLPPWAYGS